MGEIRKLFDVIQPHVWYTITELAKSCKALGIEITRNQIQYRCENGELSRYRASEHHPWQILGQNFLQFYLKDQAGPQAEADSEAYDTPKLDQTTHLAILPEKWIDQRAVELDQKRQDLQLRVLKHRIGQLEALDSIQSAGDGIEAIFQRLQAGESLTEDQKTMVSLAREVAAIREKYIKAAVQQHQAGVHLLSTEDVARHLQLDIQVTEPGESSE